MSDVTVCGISFPFNKKNRGGFKPAVKFSQVSQVQKAKLFTFEAHASNLSLVFTQAR